MQVHIPGYAPSGSHISDGTITSTGSSLSTTTTNVTVNFGTTAGLVRVKGLNACAAGSLASKTIAFTSCKPGIENDNAYSATGENDKISLYPNPGNGDFRISIHDSHIVSMAKIEVVNGFGQLVFRGERSCSKGMITLDLNNKLCSGIYLINITIGDIRTVKKLVVNK